MQAIFAGDVACIEKVKTSIMKILLVRFRLCNSLAKHFNFSLPNFSTFWKQRMSSRSWKANSKW